MQDICTTETYRYISLILDSAEISLHNIVQDSLLVPLGPYLGPRTQRVLHQELLILTKLLEYQFLALYAPVLHHLAHI